MPLRRITILALATAALVAPPYAAAKEIQQVRVCGDGGCRSAGPLGEEAFALMPPGEAMPPVAPWYRIRFGVGDGHQVFEHYKVLWAPRIHMIAVDEKHPRWLPATGAAERIARRITRGVEPFPAALMPLDLPEPDTVEVIAPAQQAAVDRKEGGAGPPWIAIPAAVLAAAFAAGAVVLRRRRSAG